MYKTDEISKKVRVRAFHSFMSKLSNIMLLKRVALGGLCDVG